MNMDMEAIKQRLLKSGLTIRTATTEDAPVLFELYRSVAKSDPNALDVQPDELTLSTVEEALRLCTLRGAALIAEKDGVAVGGIYGYTSNLRRYAHILCNMRLFVLSQCRSLAGTGFLLLQFLCEKLDNSMPHIAFIHINPYKHNVTAITLYQKLGFITQPGELKDGIFIQTADSDLVPSFGTTIPMLRHNPNFDYQALLKYHQYLKSTS